MKNFLSKWFDSPNSLISYAQAKIVNIISIISYCFRMLTINGLQRMIKMEMKFNILLPMKMENR